MHWPIHDWHTKLLADCFLGEIQNVWIQSGTGSILRTYRTKLTPLLMHLWYCSFVSPRMSDAWPMHLKKILPSSSLTFIMVIESRGQRMPRWPSLQRMYLQAMLPWVQNKIVRPSFTKSRHPRKMFHCKRCCSRRWMAPRGKQEWVYLQSCLKRIMNPKSC